MSMFPKVDRLISNLQNIDINKIIDEVEREHKDEILNENKTNMLAGLDSDGVSFRENTHASSVFTTGISKETTHFDDLFETGDFQSKMLISNNRIFSSDWKTSMIRKAIPNVFGLDQSLPLIRTLVDEIMRKIKKSVNNI